MANIGTCTTRLPGLWEKDQFWSFLPLGKEGTLKKLREDGYYSATLPAKDFLLAARKYISEERLRKRYKDEYLQHPENFWPVGIFLSELEEDAVSTKRRYTFDSDFATVLSMIFPEQEIKSTWFIDGLGDYGEFVLRDDEVISQSEGNINDDLMSAEDLAEPERSAEERADIAGTWIDVSAENGDNQELPF